MTGQDGGEYLTAEEARALLGVKTATLYAYVSRGLLRSYRQGVRRQRLYRRDELEELLRVRTDDAEAGELPPAASWVAER